MYSGVYRIADHVFRIESIFGDVHDMCADYVSDGVPEFSVATMDGDIEYERAESRKMDEMEGTNVSNLYTDGYLETLAVYRRLCKRLLENDILLIHGSCLSMDGDGVLFVARSGTGKSTHTRNWRKAFGSRVLMVNDDKPLVNVATMRIYGTPWDGKHHLSANVSVPLRAVVEVTRASENFIHEVDPKDALQRMMSQTYMPSGLMKLNALRLLSAFMDKARFYVLGCNKDVDSAVVAYSGIFGK